MKYLVILFVFVLLSCKSDKRYHDEKGIEEVVAVLDSTDYLYEMKLFRYDINKNFTDPKKSPLKDEDLRAFNELAFFPVDSTYKVEANFIRTANEKPFLMTTTTERKPIYTKYGELIFKLNQIDYKLNVYQNTEIILEEGYEDYLFLPFTDKTNGEETYGGGRYIDMRIPKDSVISLDFNKAYNPYCAYNEKYSCPIVPSENDLDVEVRAGVKKFE